MYIGTQSEQGYLTDGVEGGEAIPDAVTGRTRTFSFYDPRSFTIRCRTVNGSGNRIYKYRTRRAITVSLVPAALSEGNEIFKTAMIFTSDFHGFTL
jgi:hypothetical protein